jgi:small nuclear ribonucleoprotein F
VPPVLGAWVLLLAARIDTHASAFQSQFIVNPKPFLMDLTGKLVLVKLKWGLEYQGILVAADAYMNIQLNQTEEYLDKQLAGYLGEVLIRCNNILYIKAAPIEQQPSTTTAVPASD